MKRLERDRVFYHFDPDHPVSFSAEVGDHVLFETQDCFGGKLQTESDLLDLIDMNQMNPCTGPLYVEGADVGSTLEIRIEKIDVITPGIMVIAPGEGVLSDYLHAPKTVFVDIDNEKTIYKNGIEIRNKPHVGTIGTTFIGRIPTGRTGNHGGNMDCPLVCEGSTLYLPVFVKGGMLMLGDVHAAMGEGEICIGVECAANVIIKIVAIHKNIFIESPLIENEDSWIVTSDAPDLKQGIFLASKRMVDFLVRKTDLTTEEANILMSVAGDVRLSQAAEAGYNYTLHAVFPKEIFTNGELDEFRSMRY